MTVKFAIGAAIALFLVMPASAFAVTATTGSATGVGTEVVTLNGSVNPEGVASTYHFEYGTTVAYGQQVPIVDADAGSGSGPVAVSQIITGLSPGTTYHFQLVATDGGGTVAGGDLTFTTAPLGPPIVHTDDPFGVSATGAILRGTVNPNAGDTDYHFEFGTDTSYGVTLGAGSLLADAGETAVSVPTPTLTPGTTYHYRLVANNAYAESLGADRSFVAQAPTPGPQGPAGPAGPQGPPGRDATVKCKPKGKRVKCAVRFTSATPVRSARLSRHGVTYAKGKPVSRGGVLVLRFRAADRLARGRYTLVVVQDIDGRTVRTRTSVRVG